MLYVLSQFSHHVRAQAGHAVKGVLDKPHQLQHCVSPPTRDTIKVPWSHDDQPSPQSSSSHSHRPSSDASSDQGACGRQHGEVMGWKDAASAHAHEPSQQNQREWGARVEIKFSMRVLPPCCLRLQLAPSDQPCRAHMPLTACRPAGCVDAAVMRCRPRASIRHPHPVVAAQADQQRQEQGGEALLGGLHMQRLAHAAACSGMQRHAGPPAE